MCDICNFYKCPPRCPNAPEPKAVFVCSGCGGSIYDGDYYYDVLGEQFCETCIKNSKMEAEYDPY